MESITVTVSKSYERNQIGEDVINLALKEGLVVFGGYVRDIDILHLDTFNDIDLACFSVGSRATFLDSVKSNFYMVSLSQSKFRSSEYRQMSTIILEVLTIKITGAHGVSFPESMHISIDVVLQKSRKHWERTKDIDFSCNLFYRDEKSIGLRYIPDIDIGEKNPLKYWKTLTEEKTFFMVMGNPENLGKSQISKLVARASKLIDKNWDMYNSGKNTFTLGFYNMIKINNQIGCSICLTDFEDSSLIVNTFCKHSFCNECYQKLLRCSIKCPNCREKMCSEDTRRRLFVSPE